jgi:purine-nucleoside phosphorylase
MLLEDHINFMGCNPLIGPNLNPSMPRFPDQSEIYSMNLRDQILEIGQSVDFAIRKGVYLALSGPSFETPAEIKAFQMLGADAVGMSTVPEAMVSNALGMKVIGLSCISNLAAGIAPHKLSHKDVQNASEIALPKMKKLILVILKTLLG